MAPERRPQWLSDAEILGEASHGLSLRRREFGRVDQSPRVEGALKVENLGQGRQNVACDELPDQVQRQDHRKTSDGPGRACLAEGYVRQQFGLHVHLKGVAGIDRHDLEFADYCVSFEWPRDEAAPDLGDIPRFDPHHRRTLKCGSTQVQQAMLVDVRKFLKLPERERAGILPAVIRLKPLDHCLGTRIDPFDLGPTTARRQFSFAVAFPSEFGTAIEDGKFRALDNSGRDPSLGVGDEQLKSEVVERGPVLVDAFPYEKTKLRRRTLRLLDPQDDAFDLRVFLHTESVAVLVGDELSSRLHQGIETVYCSIEL